MTSAPQLFENGSGEGWLFHVTAYNQQPECACMLAVSRAVLPKQVCANVLHAGTALGKPSFAITTLHLRAR